MLNTSQAGSDTMFGPTGMAIGAGPLCVNAIMGQAPSATERNNAHMANSTILREDSLRIEEFEKTSWPDSWSMHFDCTSQAPYSIENKDEMMTLTSLPRLPSDNPSADLAFFLRTTGPTAPHRRPGKIDVRKVAASPKNALRFLKIGPRRSPPSPTATAPKRSVRFDLSLKYLTNVSSFDGTLYDEGDLLSVPKVPKGVEQKISSTGT